MTNNIMLNDFLLDAKKTLKQSIEVLDSRDIKVLFVVNSGQLLGSITDGDVRRYLLSGGTLKDPVIKACNRNPKKAENIEKAKALLNSDFKAIPIINSNGIIKDIYIGEKLLNNEFRKIDIPVVINAGGKGTRLEPFTKVLPKPLIPVGEYPIIEHIIQRYELFGCRKFNIIVNYKKELLKAYFKENKRKYDIRWFDEEKPLGTGGGLSLLKRKIEGPFFFVNCDNMLLADYGLILEKHKKNRNSITIVCSKKEITIPYGVVKKKGKNEFSLIEEKPIFHFSINTGIYVVEAELLEYFKDNEQIDFPDFIKKMVKKGKKIGVYEVESDNWVDMGQVDDLNKMIKRFYE